MLIFSQIKHASAIDVSCQKLWDIGNWVRSNVALEYRDFVVCVGWKQILQTRGLSRCCLCGCAVYTTA